MLGQKAAQLDTRSFSQTGRQTDRQSDKKAVRQVVWGKTGTLSSQFDSHAVPLVPRLTIHKYLISSDGNKNRRGLGTASSE